MFCWNRKKKLLHPGVDNICKAALAEIGSGTSHFVGSHYGGGALYGRIVHRGEPIVEG